MLETLLAAGQARHETLRTLQYGGAPVRPGTLRRTYEAMPGVRMLNMFGQTEGSPISVLTPQDHREAVAGRTELLRSVGLPHLVSRSGSTTPDRTASARSTPAPTTSSRSTLRAGCTAATWAAWRRTGICTCSADAPT